MTPADERTESIAVMRGLINGVLGGLVIASPVVVVALWIAS